MRGHFGGRKRLVVAAVCDVAGDVDCPAFADDCHLHLPGILELILDLVWRIKIAGQGSKAGACLAQHLRSHPAVKLSP